jgi:CubicO group peptidase (beta-lactamase class C family)
MLDAGHPGGHAMSPIRLFLLHVAGLLAATALTCAKPGPRFAQPGNNTGKYDRRVRPFLETIIREEKIPGLAVGIVEDGKLVYARGFGVINLAGPARPVTTETLFHMASVTKLFVATAVMQLVEQEKVDLDAPVTKYLPYFRLKDPRYKSITVRQMLTHTSGMPDVDDYHWDKPELDDGALERYVRGLANEGLRFKPGSRFAYSNMAFEVLGDLIAKVSGKSFEDYVESNILTPLGMNASTLMLDKANPNQLALGHTRAGDGSMTSIAHYPYNRAHSPSSNLHSNVVDMARWMMANLNRGELDGRRILKRSTYDLLWKPAVETGKQGRRVGISWFLDSSKGEQLVLHAGGDDGFLTYVCLSPDRKIGVVVMTNCDSAPAAQKVIDTTINLALER